VVVAVRYEGLARFFSPSFIGLFLPPMHNNSIDMSRIVLVTGGSSGIGRATAVFLSQRGFTVYGTGRKCTTGEKSDNFTLLRMDVTDEQSVRDALQYIEEKHGRLDAVMNNAGLGLIGPLEMVNHSEAKEVFETNVFGVLNVCRNAIPLLRKSGGGHIINVTSIGGRVGLPHRGIYCASKFAVEGLTEALSMELRKFNINVSIIEPGDFKTNINANRKYPALDRNDLYPEYPVIKNQIIEEVAFAPDPILIGQKVFEILNQKRPRLRYRVAPFAQRLSIEIKKIIPDRWFETLIMNHYKMKQKP